MNTEELVKAVSIPGCYILDSLPGGVFVLTPMESGELKNTESSHEECKSYFLQERS